LPVLQPAQFDLVINLKIRSAMYCLLHLLTAEIGTTQKVLAAQQVRQLS